MVAVATPDTFVAALMVWLPSVNTTNRPLTGWLSSSTSDAVMVTSLLAVGEPAAPGMAHRQPGQTPLFLALGHLEEVEASPKFGSNLVEPAGEIFNSR